MLHDVTSRTQKARQTEPAAQTIESLVCYIQCRSFGRVHRLEVEQHDDRLVIYGRTCTYYAKQLVQHAAQEVANGLLVDNRIEVSRRG